MSQILSSAAVVIGALRVNIYKLSDIRVSTRDFSTCHKLLCAKAFFLNANASCIQPVVFTNKL